jgi:4-amino-4-deoxy-L-arabinose transferase-like glycosyltransferase
LPASAVKREYTIYAVALAVSISIWCMAIRSPLWLDETVSMFLIQGGFHGIMSRQAWPDSPAYSCLLWLWTKAMGTGEVLLRISSVLPMLAAVYLLYRAARKLFDQDVAFITAIVFCLHPIVIFAAIDIRPYAFAVLALNAAILALVHLRQNHSNWLAALFGLSAACAVDFQLLFGAILPALLTCFVALKVGNPKILWRQLSVSLAAFALAFLPVVPRLQYMLHTSATHVFSEAPSLLQLVSTLTIRALAIILVIFLLLAARKHLLRPLGGRGTVLLCSSLALVPLVLLYALSVGTSIHVFVPRYRLVAVPGIALCWGLLVNRIDSRSLRLWFCAALVAVTAFVSFSSHSSWRHQYSWKYALQFAQQNASADDAPVLICSDLPESDYMRMPAGSAAIEKSGILPSLSYYKLSVPVVALPRSLNDEAKRVGSQWLEQAAQRRFLALAFLQSYSTLDWLAKTAAATHKVRELGAFDGVKVLEFLPRTPGQ